MISTTTPLLGSAGNALWDLLTTVYGGSGAPEPVLDYLVELDRLCDLVGFDFRVLAAQSYHECFNPETGKPWDSERWVRNRNPAGLGIESDTDKDPATFTGVEAARVHVWALLVATDSTRKNIPRIDGLPAAKIGGFAARWLAKYTDLACPTVRTVADLGRRYVDATGEPQATWGWDERYAHKIVDRASAIFGVKESPDSDTTPEPSKGRDTMPIIAKECPVETYVQWSGSNRPGLAMPSPSKIVTHEVGNKSPGADEDMHRIFVLSGGGQYQVSFHFVVGPDKIVQLLYLDENAWHASDGFEGDGNRDGWGIEHIQIGDFNKTLAHGAWLQAELAKNPRRFAIKNPAAFTQDITPANVRDRMVRHYDEAPDKKWCPEQIMNRDLWEPYKDAVVAAANPAPAKPTFVAPAPIPYEPGDIGWYTLNGCPVYALVSEVVARKGAVRRAWASGDAPKAGPTLTNGQKVQAIGSFAIDRTDAKGRVKAERWILLDDLSRVRGSSMSPLLPIKP